MSITLDQTVDQLCQHMRERRTKWGTAERIHCKSGLHLSVQGSKGHYCSPKSDEGPWHMVEVAFPSRRVMALAPYRDGSDAPLTKTVYPFVPVTLVASVIEKNGGLK